MADDRSYAIANKKCVCVCVCVWLCVSALVATKVLTCGAGEFVWAADRCVEREVDKDIYSLWICDLWPSGLFDDLDRIPDTISLSAILVTPAASVAACSHLPCCRCKFHRQEAYRGLCGQATIVFRPAPSPG